MIRRATLEDVPAVVEMGEAFHAYSPWAAVPYDADAVAAFVARLVEGGGVFLGDGGMCGGMIAPLYFNPAVQVAVELFWWAPRGQGRALREAFEAWAAEHGAHPQFSALADDQGGRMDQMFARAGYRRAETAYVKGL